MVAAATTSRRLPRLTLPARIAARLRDDILAGAYPPGAQLNEAALAEGFGVSRGPLREAMQRLVQEGLLRSLPHRGVFVPELAESDLLDVFFVRGVIEAAAIRRLLGQGRGGEVRPALLEITARMATALADGDWAAGGELDMAFHRTLVDAADSPRLARTYATVQAETRLCLHMLMDGYRRSAALAEEHVRLAELIGAGELEAALAELQRHFGDPVRVLRKARAGGGGARG